MRGSALITRWQKFSRQRGARAIVHSTLLEATCVDKEKPRSPNVVARTMCAYPHVDNAQLTMLARATARRAVTIRKHDSSRMCWCSQATPWQSA
eukprot:12367304-Alexandrium_andersonii.AAC.1